MTAAASLALAEVVSVEYEVAPAKRISTNTPTAKISTAPTRSRRAGPVSPSQKPVTLVSAPIVQPVPRPASG